MSTAQVQSGGGAPQVADKPGAGRTFTVLLGHVMSLQARSVAIWGVALGVFGVMMVAIFPAIADGPGLEQLTDVYPEGMMEAVGIEGMASLATIEGFLNAEIFGLVLPLAIPFFAILAAAGAIAGAEENGTIDVLMSNPLPRWQLVAAYFVSTAVSLAGILALFGVILWGSALFIDAELPLGTAAEGVFGAWPLALFFGGLAMLASAVFHRKMLAVGVAGGVLFAMYFLDVVSGLVEDLEFLKYFSAIHHYGAPLTEGIDWASFAGLTGAAMVLAAVAIFAFQKRDIYT
ncbi:ABC transporter permease subunit [soil metagenome]|jgi:ABC-2 type transport system permease protein